MQPGILEAGLGGITLQSSQVTPHDLAIGLTLLEGDNYSALHPSDYMMHLSKRQSTKIKTLYDVNNKIKVWATESILHFSDVHDRAEVLKFFIHTAVVSL
jgi:son of sevenless-like protein